MGSVRTWWWVGCVVGLGAWACSTPGERGQPAAMGGGGAGVGSAGGGTGATVANISGEVRVFSSAESASAGAAPRRESSASREALEALHADLRSPGTAPLPSLPTSQLVAGDFLVGTSAPWAPDALMKRLGWSAQGLDCRVAEYVLDTIQVVKCRWASGAALTEQQTRALVTKLPRAEGVKFVEANEVHRAQAVPDDPDYALQWHYAAMGLPAAWDITTGSTGLVVAVIDTGVGSHADLSGKLLPGFDFVSDSTSSLDGDGRDGNAWDECGSLDPKAGGSHWHGTHVAGTIAAKTNDGSGLAGVAWGARIVPVRVLGKAGGTTADIAAGIVWASGGSVPGVALNANPAQVMNLSLAGAGAPSQTYQTAIDDALSRGAIAVVAAGNDDIDTSSVRPCNQQNVICVGATDARGYATGYTNFGLAVTISAPGGAVDRDDNGDGRPDGVYSTFGDGTSGWLQGTSMATPHVTGLVALMKSLSGALTFSQIREALRGSASPIPNCASSCGAGLVDAARVLSSLQTTQTTPGRLSVSSSAVVLTADAPSASVRLTNVGTTPVQVTFKNDTGVAASITWNPATVPLPLSAGQSATVTVGWTGAFTAPLDVPAYFAGGDVDVPITLRVRIPRPAPRTVVAAAFPRDGGWGIAAMADAAADGRYTLSPPAGSYVLVGVADDDGDGTFEPTESEGLWPSVDAPQVVTVVAGQQLRGMNFSLAPLRTPPVPIGAACVSNDSCGAGDFCATGAYVSGYCTRDCTSAACGAAAECLATPSSGSYCFASCTGTAGQQGSCRPGYLCQQTPDSSGTVCLPS